MLWNFWRCFDHQSRNLSSSYLKEWNQSLLQKGLGDEILVNYILGKIETINNKREPKWAFIINKPHEIPIVNFSHNIMLGNITQA